MFLPWVPSMLCGPFEPCTFDVTPRLSTPGLDPYIFECSTQTVRNRVSFSIDVELIADVHDFILSVGFCGYFQCGDFRLHVLYYRCCICIRDSVSSQFGDFLPGNRRFFVGSSSGNFKNINQNLYVYLLIVILTLTLESTAINQFFHRR